MDGGCVQYVEQESEVVVNIDRHKMKNLSKN